MTNEMIEYLLLLENEQGYLEKKNRNNLYDKTLNAGNKNYTKYWEELKPSWQGQPWCACFVSWGARKLNISEDEIPTFYDCNDGVRFYKSKRQFNDGDKNPYAGNIVFFGEGSRSTHVGVVLRSDNGRILTIEGNTSSDVGVIPNGGAVCIKEYKYGYKKILGYGEPNYNMEEIAVNYSDWCTFKERYDKEQGKKCMDMNIAPGEFNDAISVGITDGTRPQNYATRQEAAIMSIRAASIDSKDV